MLRVLFSLISTIRAENYFFMRNKGFINHTMKTSIVMLLILFFQFNNEIIFIFNISFIIFSSDLCSAFGSKLFGVLDVEPVNELLTQGRRSRVNKTKTLATWAIKEMRKLKTATSSW